MKRLAKAAVCSSFAVGVALAPATAFAATGATCDSYSHTCVKHQHYSQFHHTQVLPLHVTTPSTLPFTGADIAGMSLAGLAAIGGGAALVVAGRRRRATATA